MTKTEFLQQLYNHLQPLADNERDEIIQDFEEHFSAGFESGKTEEQICAELGNPYNCALQYLRQPYQAKQPSAAQSGTQAENEKMYGQGREYNTVKTTPQATSIQYDRRNRFLWGMLFIFFVICAVGIYPTAICLMASPIVVAVAAIFAVAAVPTGLMVGFMVSICVALFAAGLLTFLLMTWLLKLSYKKSGL